MAAPKREQFKKKQHTFDGVTPPTSKKEPIATSALDSAIGAISAPNAIFKKHGVEIRKEYLEKLKDLAYWQRRRLRDLLDDALGEYLETHAETHEQDTPE